MAETKKRFPLTMVKSRKRAKTGLSRYIDDMAEEDEEDNDHSIEAARLKHEEDKDMKSEMERQDRRRNQETKFQGTDADVLGVVKSLHERYQRTTQLANDLDENNEGLPFARGSRTSLSASRQEATRQANAPSLIDPRLWVVPCKTGCECEAVISLMNKCIAMTRQGRPAGVCSAMATGLRGFIYLESQSEAAARAAVKGLRLLRGWSIRMVPMNDMVAVVATDLDVSIQRSARRRRLKVGDWARVSRDKYRNDLCRVVSLANGASSAVIMLVPRISVTERENHASKVRPPKRLFNAPEIVAAGGNVTQRKFRFNEGTNAACHSWALADKTFDIYENGSYLQGFLYKEVNVASMLQAGDANPTLDELHRFAIDVQDNGERESSLLKQMHDLAHASGTGKQDKGAQQGMAMFAQDDKVETVQGEMRGIVFIVESVDSKGIVHCRARDDPHLKGVTILMEPQRLVKSIHVGSHVKVRDGKFSGETGVVLERGELDGDYVAVILTDCGGREITERLAHVHESNEISRGLDMLEGFELHDMILLTLGAVGVVTHVAKGTLQVLMSNGDVQMVRPSEVVRKLNNESTRNVSLDSRDEHVRETDHVTLEEGHDAGTIASVVRTYRASLWLIRLASGATIAPRGGLIVRKARQVRVAGDRASGTSLATNYMGLGRQRMVNEDQFNSSSSGVPKGPGGRDPLIGRTVRICKGSYKGLAGIVTAATSTHATVELHTRNRSVTQLREYVKIVSGTAGGAPELAVQRRGFEQEAYHARLVSTPLLTQSTPLFGGATPQHGATTPHHATPSHSTTTPTWGNTTPAYGSQTPNYGPQTPSHGLPYPGIAQTPAHLDDVWRPRPRQDSGHVKTYKSPKVDVASPGQRKDHDGRADTPCQGPPLLPKPSGDTVWCVQGAEGRLKDGQICKVLQVNRGAVTVSLRSAPASTRSLPASSLHRVNPKAGDKVLVVDGGKVYDAELLSIEDFDGIIKLGNGEYKIIDFSAIAKAASF